MPEKSTLSISRRTLEEEIEKGINGKNGSCHYPKTRKKERVVVEHHVTSFLPDKCPSGPKDQCFLEAKYGNVVH